MLKDVVDLAAHLPKANKQPPIPDGCCPVSKWWQTQPHGLQHARLPCPSLYPGACSNSRPLSLLEMPSYHLILCRPLRLLLSVFPSIRVFSNESALCISWPKYWSFSFSISPSSEYSGLIPFRIDWFDFLTVCHETG